MDGFFSSEHADMEIDERADAELVQISGFDLQMDPE